VGTRFWSVRPCWSSNVVSGKGSADGCEKSLCLQSSEEYENSDLKSTHNRTRRAQLMPKKTRTVLYMRVSTADQKPDLQVDNLRDYAKRANLQIDHEYLDVAVSGRKEGHPQLNALMKAARNREFDCVLVWKFDRFARSTRHLLTALEEFDHLAIRFISMQDQIDTSSPMGKAMFTIIGAMAELESSLISERVTAGMQAAKARGKQMGRPPIPKRWRDRAEELAATTNLSIRKIHERMDGKVSRTVIGEIVKRVRVDQAA